MAFDIPLFKNRPVLIFVCDDIGNGLFDIGIAIASHTTDTFSAYPNLVWIVFTVAVKVRTIVFGIFKIIAVVLLNESSNWIYGVGVVSHVALRVFLHCSYSI